MIRPKALLTGMLKLNFILKTLFICHVLLCIGVMVYLNTLISIERNTETRDTDLSHDTSGPKRPIGNKSGRTLSLSNLVAGQMRLYKLHEDELRSDVVDGRSSSEYVSTSSTRSATKLRETSLQRNGSITFGQGQFVPGKTSNHNAAKCRPIAMCPQEQRKTTERADRLRARQQGESHEGELAGSGPLLTLFTTWSAADITKRAVHVNTIQSLSRLRLTDTKSFNLTAGDVTLILYSDVVDKEWLEYNGLNRTVGTGYRVELELIEFARKSSWIIHAPPKRSKHGVPVLGEMFRDARTVSPNSYFYGYANGDMLFARNLLETLAFIRNHVTLQSLQNYGDTKLVLQGPASGSVSGEMNNGASSRPKTSEPGESDDISLSRTRTGKPRAGLDALNNYTKTNPNRNQKGADAPRDELPFTDMEALESFTRPAGLMIIGQRTNVKIAYSTPTRSKKFGSLNIASVDELISGKGLPEGVPQPRLHNFGAYAIDYFITSHDGYEWHNIPPFVIGHIGYDNWLVVDALMRGVSVVDATETILAIHQTGDDGNYGARRRNASTEQLSYNVGLINAPFVRENREFLFGLGRTTCANYLTRKTSKSNFKITLEVRPSHISCAEERALFMAKMCCMERKQGPWFHLSEAVRILDHRYEVREAREAARFDAGVVAGPQNNYVHRDGLIAEKVSRLAYLCHINEPAERRIGQNLFSEEFLLGVIMGTTLVGFFFYLFWLILN